MSDGSGSFTALDYYDVQVYVHDAAANVHFQQICSEIIVLTTHCTGRLRAAIGDPEAPNATARYRTIVHHTVCQLVNAPLRLSAAAMAMLNLYLDMDDASGNHVTGSGHSFPLLMEALGQQEKRSSTAIREWLQSAERGRILLYDQPHLRTT